MSKQKLTPYGTARKTVLNNLPKRAVGAEIGVWKGDFSQQILGAAEPKVLHLIDPWVIDPRPDHEQAWYGPESGTDMESIFQEVATRFAAEVSSGQIVINRGRSSSVLDTFDDAYLDFVYIDGDHAYDGVRADLFGSFPKVRRGGLLCVDDHHLEGWWKDGVVRAVNELLGAHSDSLMVLFAANSQVMLRKL